MATHVILNPDKSINNVQRTVYHVYYKRANLRPELAKSFDSFTDAADYVEWQHDIYADPRSLDYDATADDFTRADDAEECEFSYGNVRVYIETEVIDVEVGEWNDYLPEVETPFEDGTMYPCRFTDGEGNNAQVEYVDGSYLGDTAYLYPFAELPELIQEEILDNINEEDREAVLNGEAYATPIDGGDVRLRSKIAILYA